ncbi:TPA: hypothetical protein RK000_001399 [Escherichia coli]|nr:hypothetical protein [Escherichia coli]HCJ9220226.1 hypothetical protein [Escherichia coli]HDW0753439.1 hypothetical protein [Escherichia coli]
MAAVDVILAAEQRGGLVEQSGWDGRKIDDAEWTITTLTHTVSPDNGFTTSLELEVRIDDFEME